MGFEWNSKVILRDITGLESEREFLWDFDGISIDFKGFGWDLRIEAYWDRKEEFDRKRCSGAFFATTDMFSEWSRAFKRCLLRTFSYFHPVKWDDDPMIPYTYIYIYYIYISQIYWLSISPNSVATLRGSYGEG